MSLSEIMDDLANQQMQIQLASQGTQLRARPAIQNRLRYPTRPAQTGYDAAHGGDLNVACRVSDEVDVAAVELATDRNPPGIDRNPRRLIFERIETVSLEKTFESPASGRTLFTNQANHGAGG